MCEYKQFHSEQKEVQNPTGKKIQWDLRSERKKSLGMQDEPENVGQEKTPNEGM